MSMFFSKLLFVCSRREFLYRGLWKLKPTKGPESSCSCSMHVFRRSVRRVTVKYLSNTVFLFGCHCCSEASGKHQKLQLLGINENPFQSSLLSCEKCEEVIQHLYLEYKHKSREYMSIIHVWLSTQQQHTGAVFAIIFVSLSLKVNSLPLACCKTIFKEWTRFMAYVIAKLRHRCHALNWTHEILYHCKATWSAMRSEENGRNFTGQSRHAWPVPC